MIDDYKIVIISCNDEKRGRIDGKLEYYGKRDDDVLHAFYLTQYIRENYSDSKLLGGLKVTHGATIISSLLAMYGNIVFLNITDYKEDSLKKYGKTGIFFMPDNVSDEMRRSLGDFSGEIADFDVEINYNFRLVDGIVDTDTFRTMEKIAPREMLNKYFDGKVKKR